MLKIQPKRWPAPPLNKKRSDLLRCCLKARQHQFTNHAAAFQQLMGLPDIYGIIQAKLNQSGN
jgi:hypothetical protein